MKIMSTISLLVITTKRIMSFCAMRNNTLLGIIIILISMCPEASSQPKNVFGKVTSADNEKVTINIGENKGITVGKQGIVYYTLIIRNEKKMIDIAKVRVISVLNNSCEAEVIEKTKDLVGQEGLFTRFSVPVSVNASKKTATPREVRQTIRGDYGEFIVEMVSIPAGEFMMGSDNGEDDEKPVHRVKVDAFYIGKHEVTQREWTAVMGSNPANFKGDDLPVENVSWIDIQEYLQKLSSITGKRWRLPTEAEWEYACRAGSTTEFCFGDKAEQLDEYAWYDKDSDQKTHPVGQKKPNVWGLYDMHGNVWEWCQDWYDEKYYTDSPLINPTGPSTGQYRVLRGGSWLYDDFYVRLANRSSLDPGLRSYADGFRCLQEP